jgi:large subunit ribosomal protein L15
MELDNLSPAPGSHHARKRVGRGSASGHGSFSGRGCKGNKARAGFSNRPGFEGGQLPIIKRLPEKRGFVNLFRVGHNVVNLEQLNSFRAGTVVTSAKLFEAGLIKRPARPLKVLGAGELKKALTVQANQFSATAKEKIAAAGGTAEEIAYAAESG